MFRFTTRDLLWLMVVVGLAVGWWVDRHVWRSKAPAWIVYTELNIIRQLKLSPGQRATIEMDNGGNIWLKRDESSKAIQLKRE